MTRQAALFDLDGVLLDSGPAVRTALAAVATCATGHRTTPADLPPGALRRPRAEVLTLLEVSDPDDACSRWWDGALAAALPTAFAGVLTGLLALRTVNVALGVVTLQDRDRLPWYLPPALTDLLDVVITRQDAPAKPAPDGLHAALDRVGVRPEQAVFVGDSPGDMTAARAAGVLALGATWGLAPARGPPHGRSPSPPARPHPHRSVPPASPDPNPRDLTHPPRYSGRAPETGALPDFRGTQGMRVMRRQAPSAGRDH